jgi:hypothetical protein
MLTIVTEKRANGRRMIYLVLEPQDIDHIKMGEPVAGDTSRVEGHDILICFAPDGERFKNMIAAELRALDPEQPSDSAMLNFGQLLKTIQQYPEVRRPVKAGPGRDLRQDVDKKTN